MINLKKSIIFPVCFSRKLDFLPRLSFDNNELAVTYLSKILGVVFSSSGEWDDNTNYLTSKANSRLHFLRRLKNLGAKTSTLLEVYTLFIRSILEYCAPLWAGNLKKSSVRALERVERNVMHLLFPGKNYDNATREAQIVKLTERRFILTKRYSEKLVKNPKFAHLFKQRQGSRTRGHKLFQEIKFRRNCHKFSVVPVLTKILNGETKVFRN